MVRNSKASNLRETIEEATVTERLFAKDKAEKAKTVEKRRWESPPSSYKKPKFQPSNKSFDNRWEAKWYPKCKRTVYFECKEIGHIRRECPKLRGGARGGNYGSQTKREAIPKAQGRAFQMTKEETMETAEVVSGTFLLNSTPARVLFDSGANFSFVSDVFCKSLNLSASVHSDALVIEFRCGDWDGPVGEASSRDLMFKEIHTDSHPRWRLPIVYGEKRKGDVAIITSIKARKYLTKKYPSYLAFVVDAKIEKKKVGDVKIVNEFPDVFPDDLPGLPPDRQVEF
ncbi:hypothetical protein L6452_08451 [Arctium lappa]|uniref:Uncharacterized protein n=1 Tax=Arctium lappa TaxID=4217 RepID=A0ACB9DHY3_ARCLA|nr:hypothetical protein L6452_08451 [Arctium lappa]